MAPISLTIFAGGSLAQLADCAGRRGVAALWTLADGEWLVYIPGAPDFVNAAFAARFPGGIPAGEPLGVRSDGAAETDSR